MFSPLELLPILLSSVYIRWPPASPTATLDCTPATALALGFCGWRWRKRWGAQRRRSCRFQTKLPLPPAGWGKWPWCDPWYACLNRGNNLPPLRGPVRRGLRQVSCHRRYVILVIALSTGVASPRSPSDWAPWVSSCQKEPI